MWNINLLIRTHIDTTFLSYKVQQVDLEDPYNLPDGVSNVYNYNIVQLINTTIELLNRYILALKIWHIACYLSFFHGRLFSC